MPYTSPKHKKYARQLRRDTYLKAQGFQVLRFWDHDVLQHTDAVLETIARYITPPPQPSSAREEGDASNVYPLKTT